MADQSHIFAGVAGYFGQPDHPVVRAVRRLDGPIRRSERAVGRVGVLPRGAMVGHRHDAAEGVRERVNETLAQARARLAATSSEAEKVVNTLADRADDYVRRNPWQAVALAALLGGVVTFVLSKSLRRG